MPTPGSDARQRRPWSGCGDPVRVSGSSGNDTPAERLPARSHSRRVSDPTGSEYDGLRRYQPPPPSQSSRFQVPVQRRGIPTILHPVRSRLSSSFMCWRAGATPSRRVYHPRLFHPGEPEGRYPPGRESIRDTIRSAHTKIGRAVDPDSSGTAGPTAPGKESCAVPIGAPGPPTNRRTEVGPYNPGEDNSNPPCSFKETPWTREMADLRR